MELDTLSLDEAERIANNVRVYRWERARTYVGEWNGLTVRLSKRRFNAPDEPYEPGEQYKYDLYVLNVVGGTVPLGSYYCREERCTGQELLDDTVVKALFLAAEQNCADAAAQDAVATYQRTPEYKQRVNLIATIRGLLNQ